jgi:transcriptional regulator with XRE-family HTH domain
LDQGLSVRQLRAKISEEHSADVSESSILGIEKDRTPNPGFKTIEYIALGVGLDPLEVISLGLDDPPELEHGFKESQFAQMWRAYKQIGKEQKPFADELIKMVRERLSRWN